MIALISIGVPHFRQFLPPPPTPERETLKNAWIEPIGFWTLFFSPNTEFPSGNQTWRAGNSSQILDVPWQMSIWTLASCWSFWGQHGSCVAGSSGRSSPSQHQNISNPPTFPSGLKGLQLSFGLGPRLTQTSGSSWRWRLDCRSEWPRAARFLLTEQLRRLQKPQKPKHDGERSGDHPKDGLIFGLEIIEMYPESSGAHFVNGWAKARYQLL